MDGPGMDKVNEPDLLRRSREGDRDAFDELFRHHYASAVRYAARVTSSLDPEDLTAEAFARIWATISGGGGPEHAFGKYLRTTIKNLAVNTATRRNEEPAEDDRLDYWLRRDAQVADDGFSAMLAEHEAVAEAFETLPQRWRSVLWMIDVEGRRTADVAVRLGLTANSAAALTKRARAALSQAWLTTQLDARSSKPECAWVHDHLSGFARDTLTTAQRERVRVHLDECDDCDRAAHRVAHLATSLRIVALIAGGSLAGLATLYSAAEPAQAAGPHGGEAHAVGPHGVDPLAAGGSAAGAAPVEIATGGGAGKSAGKATSSGSQAGIVAAAAAVAVVALTAVIASSLNSPNVHAEQPSAASASKTQAAGALSASPPPRSNTPSSTPEPPQTTPEDPTTTPAVDQGPSSPATAARTTPARPTSARPASPPAQRPTSTSARPTSTRPVTAPTRPPLTSTMAPSSTPTTTSPAPTGIPASTTAAPTPTSTTPAPPPQTSTAAPTPTDPATTTPAPTEPPTTTPTSTAPTTPAPTPTSTAPTTIPTTPDPTAEPTRTRTPHPTPTWTWTWHPHPTPTWTWPAGPPIPEWPWTGP